MAALFSSCNDFQEINEDPNQVDESKVKPEWFLNASIVGDQMNPEIAERMFILTWNRASRFNRGSGFTIGTDNNDYITRYLSNDYAVKWLNQATKAVQLGEKKVALYAVIPDNDNTFNFLVSLLYAQAFQALYYSADQIHHGPLPRHVRFVLDEFAAMPLPGFTRELATMRSRSISASVIIQNMAQIKELYKDSWETIPGNCDTILYLGGNESSTHKYVSEMLGKATIDTKTHGQTKGKSGSYSTNFQMSGRELLTPDEVRKLDNRYALLFIRGASPVMDEKYDLMHHPAISRSSLGGATPYIHHGSKPSIYTGRPLFRVGSTENLNPLKEEFH